MIEWLLTGNNVIEVFVCGISLAIFLIIVSSITEKNVLTYIGIGISVVSIFISTLFFASTTYDGSEWTTIYTNGDNISINISLIDDGSTIVMENNKELGSSYDWFNKSRGVLSTGTITAADSKDQVTYDILLKRENIIENKKLNVHSQIIKVEYRKITSQQKQFGQFKGNPYPFDHDGELRITVDDGDNKIKQLFEPKN